MSVMLENGVIPIVNENDTVSVTELMFTDNDELSGLIASMMNADMLIILSNVDGICTGEPGTPGAGVIATVGPGDDVTSYIRSGKSSAGRGGMTTKCGIARKIADEGISVIIANGRRENVLRNLITQPGLVPHTTFTPDPEGVSGVKKWLAHSESFAKGVIRINDKARDALCGDAAASLLMVGVTAVEGEFEESDIVNIVASDGQRLAVGRSAYCSDDARRLIGKHDVRPVVHYDYLYME